MGLPTQVAQRNRQSASLYPFPLTPILGLLNFASASIVVGILADFIYELRGDRMSVPSDLAVVISVAALTVVEQLVAFVRQRFSMFPARINLICHAFISAFWLAAFVLLSYRLRGMVLTQRCTVAVWRTDVGVMVCQMYKAMYSFSAISLATSVAITALDWRVVSMDKSAGVYRPLAGKSPGMGMEPSPMIGALQQSPMIGTEKPYSPEDQE